MPLQPLTEEQYLAIERAASCKSEFYRGEMFAMAGGSLTHGILQMNVGTEINTKLIGRDCGAFGSDVKIKVGAAGLFTYPDLSVVCGPPITIDEHQDTITNPIVIV